ncbi:PadR family transcriptional regulator [Facklamia miroungae]|uniref:Transcriptional regulator PadR-like family protein n=1 Tax=Facklamia miroungae TaxID=120956 RepID=A0A1G7RUU8_9LACT|nr:PadR family transcriptional regulator [Facklamia miroungae]NKZ29295.1 PadR family transcriptional regulator [Facklamia miroungae]SDG13640.1 Transcriptional regulator PadR-like family protein [Facklamia miroungae]
MSNSDVFRGYNDLFVLAILNKGDSYGYEIGKQISLLSQQEYIMKETTLYSVFNRLKKEGLIEDYPGIKTNGRQRTYYRLTALGKKVLQEKVKEWKLVKQIVENIIKGV